ncbi:hypothetical protein GCM10010840_27580 [Deinococcus aerolatus]|uniref:Uncharacterized protein n=1 Tax=Deinococcus aerolatus TaxID=522487 RepID=A0ABQ2GD17_9DEIO|nr:hypothetical protein [Deinococcus aerolatus]GGL88017.1 hypothetical protein GCM10010840_27580 [Deinococcus aerolatus]
MTRHGNRGGLLGILAGLLFLAFSFMHIAAHGLDASPDHAVVLGVSQDTWFALGLLPYPLQIYAFLSAMGALKTQSRPLSRVLLWLALLGLCASAVGHAFLAVPYTEDWRTAPTQQIGWSTFALGNLTFALSVLLGALSVPSAAGGPRVPLIVIGGALLSSFPLAMLDADHGYEFTLVPTLLYGLGWAWMGATLLRHAPASVAVEAAVEETQI